MKPMKTMHRKTPDQMRITSPRMPTMISLVDVNDIVDMNEFYNINDDIDHEIVILPDLVCPFDDDDLEIFISECDPIQLHEIYDSFEQRYSAVREFMLILLTEDDN
jgi:hypothetical protein